MAKGNVSSVRVLRLICNKMTEGSMATNTSDEILELIRQEDDRETKTVYLLLLRMSNVLEENTKAVCALKDDVKSHRSELQLHKEEFAAAASRAEGARRLWVPGLAILQMIALAFCGVIYRKHEDTESRIAILQQHVAVLDAADSSNSDANGHR